jgi:seryl-tRNA synthetase
MIDTNIIKNNPQIIEENLKKRNLNFPLKDMIDLEIKKRELLTQINLKNAEKNKLSLLMKDREFRKKLLEKYNKLNNEYIEIKNLELKHRNDFEKLYYEMPNILDDSVPIGLHENDNVIIYKHLVQTNFTFEPKPHYKISMIKTLFNFEDSTKISGNRTAILIGPLAKLERVLGQYMLDTQVENGFTEVNTPVIVNEQALFNTGQLPKFKNDLYKIENSHLNKYLLPTAEVTLTNLFANTILDTPTKKLTALTQCFRSEAGAAGKDQKGILRQHQFAKIELVAATKPENSEAMLEEITNSAESILINLKLPYRKMLLCSGDTGFSSKKTYDLEVWIPSENKYREISSCSNCGDFQARRMNARFKRTKDSRPEFVHTLNGSGLAVGRTLIAVLENYQTENGNVKIPDVLIPRYGKEYLI